MPNRSADPRHFTKTVAELSRSRPVVTTQAIFNVHGHKIAEEGVTLSPDLYERLMQHKLSAPLENSVSSVPTVTNQMLRDGVASLIASNPFFARMAVSSETRERLLGTMSRVPLPDPVAFQLTLAYEVRRSLYEHSLSAALVAGWLAIQSGASDVDVWIAASAGLVHDLGLLHLDPQLLDFRGEISRAQRHQLYLHPLVSTALVERHFEFPKEVRHAVMDHHEFLDGSGYPRHLVGEQIGLFARILALTELVIGAVAPGREVSDLKLSILLRMNLHRYDEALAAHIIQMLQPRDTATTPASSAPVNPLHNLLEIDATLAGWPVALSSHPAMTPQQRKKLDTLTEQVAQLRRTLARVGASPDQLALLGNDTPTGPLQTELVLIAGEAAWQLKTLSHHIRFRCNPAPGAAMPSEIQAWLKRVDALVSYRGNARTDEPEVGASC